MTFVASRPVAVTASKPATRFSKAGPVTVAVDSQLKFKKSCAV